MPTIPCVFCETTNGHHHDGCPIHENVLKLGNAAIWNMGYSDSQHLDIPRFNNPEYLLGFRAGQHKTIEQHIALNGGGTE